jgi:hypothetical protein
LGIAGWIPGMKILAWMLQSKQLEIEVAKAQWDSEERRKSPLTLKYNERDKL